MPIGEDGAWRPYTQEELDNFEPPKASEFPKRTAPVAAPEPIKVEAPEPAPTPAAAPPPPPQLDIPDYVSGEDPTDAELNEIGFDIQVDPVQGTIPQYDKEKLRALRHKRSIETPVSPAGAMGFAVSAGTTGFTAEGLDKYRKAQQNIAEAFEASDRKTDRIYQKAREKGFSSLSEDELTWIETKWSPEEVFGLHALTADHGYEVSEKMAKNLAAGVTDKLPLSLPTPGVGLGFAAAKMLLSRESDQPPEERPEFTSEQINDILGKTNSVLARRVQARRIVEEKEKQGRKQQTADTWDRVVDERPEFLKSPIRDMVVEDYLDGKGSLDIEAARAALIRSYQHDFLEEEGKTFFTRDVTLDMRRIAYSAAKKKADEEIAVVLNAGRGGIAWVDPDPKRTTEAVMAAHEKWQDFWETEETIKIDQLREAYKNDPLSLFTVVPAMLGSREKLFEYSIRKGLADNPFVLPLLTATTPTMAIDVAPTHRQFVARTIMDSINGWMATTWLGATLQTYSDSIKAEGVPEDGIGEAVFKAMNRDVIAKESGSEILADTSTALAGGNEAEAGFGLMKLIIGNNPDVTAATETAESLWEITKGGYNTAADVLETWAGTTGDDVKTRRMIQNLRNGNMLFQVQAEIANDFADAMDMEGWQRDTLIRAAMFSGLTAEFTPGLGADPLTGTIATMGKGKELYRATKASMNSQAKVLRKLERSKVSASEKIKIMESKDSAIDPEVTRMVKENLHMESGYRGYISEYIGRTEWKLEQAAEKARIAARAAGIEESPAVLQGSKFTDEAYKEEFIEKQVSRHFQEPSVTAERAGRADIFKVFKIENMEDAINQFEAAGEVFPPGFRGWETWKQEHYFKNLNREALEKTVREQIEATIREDITAIGSRIGETTVDGDVYKLTNSDGSFGLYMRVDNNQWVRVDEADIPALRETVLIGETTRTPLRPIERKSGVTDTWERRARQADEYPWSDAERKKNEAMARVAELERKQKQWRGNLQQPGMLDEIRAIQTELAQAKVNAQKLQAEETALRKTFPDHTAPTAPMSDDLAENLATGAALKNDEMVGATAHSIRKPVFAMGKESSESVQYHTAKLEEAREAANRAEIENFNAQKALEEWEKSEGAFLTEVQVSREVLKRAKQRLRKAKTKAEKNIEKDKPAHDDKARRKADLDAAEAEIVRRKAAYDTDSTAANHRAIKDAKKKAKEAKKLYDADELETLERAVRANEILTEVSRIGVEVQVHEAKLFGVQERAIWIRSRKGEVPRTEKMQRAVPEEGPGVLDEAWSAKRIEKELAKIRAELEQAAKIAAKKTKQADKVYRTAAKVAQEVPERIGDMQVAIKEKLKELAFQDDLNKLNKVLGKLADDIEIGTKALRGVPDATTHFNKILQTTTRLIEGQPKEAVVAGTVASREVNAVKMVEELEKLFKPRVVRKTADRGGESGRVLERILEAANNGNEKMELTLNQSMHLQRLLPLLTDTYKQSQKAARSMNVVEALRLARTDPDLQVNSFRSYIERRMQPVFRDWADPVRAEIGDTTDAVLQVVKSVDHLQDHLKDELFAIAKHIQKMTDGMGSSARARETQKMLLKYLEGTEGLPVFRTRTTYLNMGELSIFDRAMQQTLGDPRALGMKRLKKMAKAEQARLKKEVKAQIRRGEVPKGTKPPSIRELLERRWGKSVHEIGKVGTSPVVNALSRAFIADGPWKKVDAQMEFNLYQSTLDAMQKNKGNLGALVEDIKGVAKNNGLEVTANTTEALQRVANALGHGAIEYRFNRAFTRAITGKITPEQASDIWRLFGHRSEEIINYENALEGLNRIGIPFTARTVKTAGAASEKQLSLIATGTSEAGDVFFTPQVIAQRLEATMPNVIKSTAERFAQTRGDFGGFAAQSFYDYNSLWKTSVVTGIFHPQGRYWFNNFVGDLSQVWFEEGLSQALKMNANLIHTISLNTMAGTYRVVEGTAKAAARRTRIPGTTFSFFPEAIGEGLARIRKHHVAKYGEDRALGSVWNAMLNPIANRVWRGEKGVLRSQYGTEWSYAEVRKMMQDEGVLDTMVHQELMESYYRVAPPEFQAMGIGKVVGAAKGVREGITDFASFVQQRQRGNLFMDLLRKGYSPKEAGERVRSALYDWKHGISKFEVSWITKFSPFWRFFRLAGRQVARKTLDPLIRPNKAMVDAFMGKSGFSRIQQQWAVNRGWGQFWDPSGYHDYQNELEQWDAMAQYLRPSWARTRAVTSIRKNSDEEIARMMYFRRGVQEYSMLAMPPQTVLDLTEIMGSVMSFMFMSVYPDDHLPWGAKMAADAEQRFFKPTLDILFPYIADPIQAQLTAMGGDTGGFYSTAKRARISGGEELMLNGVAGVGTYGGAALGAFGGTMLGFGRARGGTRQRMIQVGTTALLGGLATGGFAGAIEDEIKPHAEYGYPTAPTWAVVPYRCLPLIGTEAPNFFDDAFFKNTSAVKAWREDKTSFGPLFAAFAEFAGRNTALYKPHPFNPSDTVRWSSEDKTTRIKELRKKAEPDPEQPERFYQRAPDSRR